MYAESSTIAHRKGRKKHTKSNCRFSTQSTQRGPLPAPRMGAHSAPPPRQRSKRPRQRAAGRPSPRSWTRAAYGSPSPTMMAFRLPAWGRTTAHSFSRTWLGRCATRANGKAEAQNRGGNNCPNMRASTIQIHQKHHLQFKKFDKRFVELFQKLKEFEQKFAKFGRNFKIFVKNSLSI